MMRLLRFIQPFQDECISSYIYRLGQANFCNGTWILDEIGYSNKAKLYLIDYINSEDLLGRLSKFLNISVEVIYWMTIHRYSSSLWNPNAYNGRRKGKPIELLIRERPVFCPYCLDEKQYCRIYWYLKPIKRCVIHDTDLSDRCPYCSKLLNPFIIASSVCSCGKSLALKIISAIKYDSKVDNHKYCHYAFTDESSILQMKSGIAIRGSDFTSLITFIIKLVDELANCDIEERVKHLDSESARKDEIINKIIEYWPYEFSRIILDYYCMSLYLSCEDGISRLNSMIMRLYFIYSKADGCNLGLAKQEVDKEIIDFLMFKTGPYMLRWLIELIFKNNIYFKLRKKNNDMIQSVYFGKTIIRKGYLYDYAMDRYDVLLSNLMPVDGCDEIIEECFTEYKHSSFYEELYKARNLSIIELYETIVDSNPYVEIYLDTYCS